MEDRRIAFSKEDEERIASAAVWGIVVAVTSIASAVLSLVLSFVGRGNAAAAIGQLVSLTVSVLLAIWLYQASVAFRKVALTDVADQQYLLEGFRKLRAYFMAMGIILIVLLSLGVLVFMGALMCRLAVGS